MVLMVGFETRTGTGGEVASSVKVEKLYDLPMIEVRLFGGIKRHAGGKNRVELASEAVSSVNDILLSIEIPREEIGQVLVNGSPVEPSRDFNAVMPGKVLHGTLSHPINPHDLILLENSYKEYAQEQETAVRFRSFFVHKT